ncbi:hypothetical protein [Cohnella yongneupensis]|uniref:Carboxypeptidase regulatory-like domain-containing protein n=1 Tax=Cohnella yongneupensis TaxID=425006 RepID=A0ABW0QX85_9BACL
MFIFLHNIKGTLKSKDGTPVSGAWLQLHGTGTNSKSYNVKVNDGAFSLRLPDSYYTIDGYWDEESQAQIQLFYTFQVTGGKPVPDRLALIVPDNNVMGTVKRYDGVSVDGVYLNIHSENAGRHNFGYNTKVNNGSFALFLADGNYVVDGYLDPEMQKKIQVHYPFQVVKGKSRSNPLKVIVSKEHIVEALYREGHH